MKNYKKLFIKLMISIFLVVLAFIMIDYKVFYDKSDNYYSKRRYALSVAKYLVFVVFEDDIKSQEDLKNYISHSFKNLDIKLINTNILIWRDVATKKKYDKFLFFLKLNKKENQEYNYIGVVFYKNHFKTVPLKELPENPFNVKYLEFISEPQLSISF
ncbi:hypothetical protein AAEX28_01610 [Lentisphaerota bacterium WC36G]|nr:hypothetical protein LJT99_04495 [Lentisphaerae bacterium WC36]